MSNNKVQMMPIVLVSTLKITESHVLQLLAVAQHHSSPHPGAPTTHTKIKK